MCLTFSYYFFSTLIGSEGTMIELKAEVKLLLLQKESLEEELDQLTDKYNMQLDKIEQLEKGVLVHVLFSNAVCVIIQLDLQVLKMRVLISELRPSSSL